MMEVDKHNFEEEVLQSELPVIVDFWGPQCQPCLKLMPKVEEFAKQYAGKVKIVKLNSQQNRRLCINHQVIGLPAFLAFKNGEEVKRISGQSLNENDIEQLIQELL